MENLKIDLTGFGNKEKQEAVWLLNELGFTTGHKSVDFYIYLYGCVKTSGAYNNTIQFGNNAKIFDRNKGKEVTIHQLKDMVILKRNDVGDATHENTIYKYANLLGSWYYFDKGETNKWMKSSGGKQEYYDKLKPIAKPQVEYLIKVAGEYTLVTGDFVPEGGIEVPEGANHLTECNDCEGVIWKLFWRDGLKFCVGHDDKWCKYDDFNVHTYVMAWGEKSSILWQRHAQDENKVSDTEKAFLDSFDDLPKVERTLNERQSQYGCYEDVAYATQSMLDILYSNTSYKNMSKPHKESIHMILSKIARLSCGDQNCIDGWHDIQGYAKLIEDLIGKENEIPF